jgi:pimeloyl-ACP methyl ester carboxylesterase
MRSHSSPTEIQTAIISNQIQKQMKKLIPLTQSGICLMIMTVLLASGSIANAQNAVKNIVLVHGAFADGSGWEGVYKILTKKGYKVSIVGNPNTGFEDDVAATKRVIDHQDGPVILVGHSYGGAIITEAGNDPKVVGLVYVSAFAPDANETLLQLVKSVPPSSTSGVLPPDANGYLWYDLTKFHASFCADLSAEQASFMADSQIPLAASVFGSSIKEPAWKTKLSWYIVATEDREISPEAERFMAKRAGATVTEIKGSHVVFISQPKAVSAVIEAAAQGALK